MELNKEVLQNDRKVFAEQVVNSQALVNYIDGLLAFLDKPEPTAPELVVETPAVEGEVIDESSP